MARDKWALLTSGSKSFNIPALTGAYGLFGDEASRSGYLSALKGRDGLSSPSVLALTAPLAGRLAQSWGRKPLLLIGFAALPIRGVLFAYVDSPYWLVAIQVFDGVSASVLGVMVPLIVSDVTRKTGRFNLALGAVGTAMGLGAAPSTSLGGYMADRLGSQSAFLGLATVGALGTGLVALVMPETRRPEVKRET